MGKSCQRLEIMNPTFSGEGIEVKEVENLSIHFCEMTTLGENSRTDVSISRFGIISIGHQNQYFNKLVGGVLMKYSPSGVLQVLPGRGKHQLGASGSRWKQVGAEGGNR